MAATNVVDKKKKEELNKLRKKFNKKIFTMDEISKHNTEESPWIVVYGGVYDMTNFQLDHPGGPDVLQDISGQDATDEFENILHTVKARKMGNDYLLGSIKDADFDHWIKNMNTDNPQDSDSEGPNWVVVVIVLLAVLAGFYFYNEQNQKTE